MKDRKINFLIEQELYNQIEKISSLEDRTIGSVIRRAINYYLENYSAKTKENKKVQNGHNN